MLGPVKSTRGNNAEENGNEIVMMMMMVVVGARKWFYLFSNFNTQLITRGLICISNKDASDSEEDGYDIPGVAGRDDRDWLE